MSHVQNANSDYVYALCRVFQHNGNVSKVIQMATNRLNAIALIVL